MKRLLTLDVFAGCRIGIQSRRRSSRRCRFRRGTLRRLWLLYRWRIRRGRCSCRLRRRGCRRFGVGILSRLSGAASRTCLRTRGGVGWWSIRIRLLLLLVLSLQFSFLCFGSLISRSGASGASCSSPSWGNRHDTSYNATIGTGAMALDTTTVAHLNDREHRFGTRSTHMRMHHPNRFGTASLRSQYSNKVLHNIPATKHSIHRQCSQHESVARSPKRSRTGCSSCYS